MMAKFLAGTLSIGNQTDKHQLIRCFIFESISQKIHAGSSWFLTVRGMRVKFSCSEKCFSIFSGIFCTNEQIGVTYAR